MQKSPAARRDPRTRTELLPCAITAKVDLSHLIGHVSGLRINMT